MIAVASVHARRRRHRDRAAAGRLEALAARVLCEDEHAAWLESAPPEQLHAFLELWTAKEAYLKAIGTGITRPLRDVPRRTRAAGPSPGSRRRSAPWRSVAVDGAATSRSSSGCRAAVSDRPRVGVDAADRQVPRHRGRTRCSRPGCSGCATCSSRPRTRRPRSSRTGPAASRFTDPIVLRLDPDHPEDSIVMIRPWLTQAHRRAPSRAREGPRRRSFDQLSAP